MQGKNIAIAGGTSGIGKALAELCISAGASVWVIARNETNIPSGAQFIQADAVALGTELDALPDTLHGLAYCVGSINLKPFHRLMEADFQSDFNVNVLGAVKVVQACLKKLKASGQASLVLFSTVAVQSGMGFHSSVASSKGAIEGLTRALAAEFAPIIRVNCIAPSLTDTPLAAQLLSTEEKREAAAKRHPLQKIGSAQDIAQSAYFLLSDHAHWTTGQVLHVDGGLGRLK